ncbi:MAG: hypothetical protein LBI48_09710 [Burkholderiaceae bacterium]|jgi:hypothetical protein|nr:hypothetical protein [Burkholderiaceae bacterium]
MASNPSEDQTSSESSSGLTAPEETSQAYRPRELVKQPRFRTIAKSYSGTSAEWLLGRIIGWHDRITPDREKDIDNILYLLEKIGYIPEDPQTAPFVALIALVWARLPLAPDLTDNPKSLMTPVAIGHQFKKIAEEMEWVTRKEFQELDKALDGFKDSVVEPKLDKFQRTLEGMAGKINGLANSPSPPVSIDTAKVSGEIAQQVAVAAKSQFKGIYLWMVGLTFVLGLFIGAWIYSIGVSRGAPQSVPSMPAHSAK